VRLQGKVAIVTGAGRGIGRGISLAFAKEGARVVLASRSEGPLNAVEAEIQLLGADALAVACDVGDLAQIGAMVEAGVAAFGPIDILVNNAQSWGAPGERTVGTPSVPPEDLPDDWWDHTFQTGVKATFACCKAVFPSMRERGGKIINFGSSVGVNGGAGMADYAANKEAIRGLSRSLARAWGRYAINVNVICPAIETDALAEVARANPQLVEASRIGRPIPRFGDAERDAGALAVFLASPESDYLTGGTFMLDGGNTML
jgi:2-hydroxycyclohexanecarboxyl-CoA dehydrogenase